jgi:hypothetical protein
MTSTFFTPTDFLTEISMDDHHHHHPIVDSGSSDSQNQHPLSFIASSQNKNNDDKDSCSACGSSDSGGSLFTPGPHYENVDPMSAADITREVCLQLHVKTRQKNQPTFHLG